MSIATIIKDYGPKTALAVAEKSGAEDVAIDRLLDDLHLSSLILHPSPDEDPERWDGMS